MICPHCKRSLDDFMREQGRRGGQSKSARKREATRKNIAKARAARLEKLKKLKK